LRLGFTKLKIQVVLPFSEFRVFPQEQVMKLRFAKGEGKVLVNFDTKETPKGDVRTTEVTVEVPGEAGATITLTAKVGCDSRDKFSRRNGRYAAFLKLLTQDNNQAYEEAVKRRDKTRSVAREVGCLSEAARPFYMLSRADRTVLQKALCPEFNRNAPERRVQREKSLLERLYKKYGMPIQLMPKTFKLDVDKLAAK
jgi:hypothetical protein